MKLYVAQIQNSLLIETGSGFTSGQDAIQVKGSVVLYLRIILPFLIPYIHIISVFHDSPKHHKNIPVMKVKKPQEIIFLRLFQKRGSCYTENYLF